MNTICTYLAALSQNNSSDWYHAHEAERKAAQAAFLALIGGLILELGRFDPSVLACDPGSLTFKLQRDTRFSHDKSPYNPTFRCHISAAGKLPIPVGYFLSIRPGGSFLGGGLFADMFKDATDRVRAYLCGSAEEFLSIVNEPTFSGQFRVDGTRLKNVPAGYPADSPAAEFLRYKSWYIEYPFDERLLDDPAAFVRFAAEKFKAMKPFNDYLNRALEGFSMPRR